METKAKPRGLPFRALPRILVASYFFAVALGLIPGTDFAALLAQFAEPNVAAVLSAVIVSSLAYMVMIGTYTRLAALLLGLLTLFAAFFGIISPNGTPALGAFWRDIALVAALMLTYAQPQAGVRPRRVSAGASPRPSAPRPEPDLPRTARIADLARARANRGPTDLRAPLGNEEIENIFAEDLSHAEVR